MSEKREKFVKLAEGRTQLALDAIRKIGNLSNSRAYEYTDADVKVILKALREATAEVERKFNSSTGETFNKFKLKG
jgi:ribosome biogenesis protein Nip4